MGALSRAAAALLLLGSAPVAAAPIDRWRGLIEQASNRFGIPARWIEQVIQAESGGLTTRDGRPIRSPAGAIGLMQLMPATWATMRARLTLGDNPDDPADNIMAGTGFLRLMYDRFGYPGLFGAYNVGPGEYARALAGGAVLPTETKAYLAKLSGCRRQPLLSRRRQGFLRCATITRTRRPQRRNRRRCSRSEAGRHDREGRRGSSRKSQHDGRRRGSQGPWVPPNLLRNWLPPRPLRGACAVAPAALTATPPPVASTPFSMVRTQALEVIIGMVESIGTTSDRVFRTLVAGLELEFGRDTGEALARRFLEAEDSDFLWEARAEERWLGAYRSAIDEEVELERIAICGRLEGRWYMSVMLVDGDGRPHGTLGRRFCRSRKMARDAVADAH